MLPSDDDDVETVAKTDKEPPVWKSLETDPDLRLSSLDLVVYSYLKEELVNCEGTPEAKYLTEKCPKLYNFYKLMEFIFERSDADGAEARANFFKVNKVSFVDKSGQSP